MGTRLTLLLPNRPTKGEENEKYNNGTYWGWEDGKRKPTIYQEISTLILSIYCSLKAQKIATKDNLKKRERKGNNRRKQDSKFSSLNLLFIVLYDVFNVSIKDSDIH